MKKKFKKYVKVLCFVGIGRANKTSIEKATLMNGK